MRVRDVATAATLARCLAHARRRHPRPDAVLLTGDLVHDDPALFALFLAATPVGELASARFGSRPAYRPGAGAGITVIRAIPWQFGWTQIRLMLTGWLGVGTALGEAAATPEGLATLRAMTRA